MLHYLFCHWSGDLWCHTVILQYWNIEKRALSNFAFQHCYIGIHLHPAKRNFEILQRILEGRTNRAQPTQSLLKNWQNGSFSPLHGFLLFGGQMTLFEVFWKCDLVTLSKICLRLHPSAYVSINLRINWIFMSPFWFKGPMNP